ncbi:PRC-barrel domain-containing protein [Patescibacteria group bacterium]|nr:PRC-barrel domain-containing protein [Patescibacteria group bacterium]
MNLSTRQLKNLPVYSKNDDCLGKIKEIEIDSNSHNITKYIIKSSQITERLAGAELIISPSQVVSIDNQKMIVEDNIIRDKNLIKEPAAI